jgi:hypothetical protein
MKHHNHASSELATGGTGWFTHFTRTTLIALIKRLKHSYPWLALSLGFGFCATLGAFLAANQRGLVAIGLQVLALVLAGVVLSISRKLLARGLLVLLAVFMGAAVFQRVGATYVWSSAWDLASFRDIFQAALGPTMVGGTAPRQVHRSWTLAPGTSDLLLTLALRWKGGTPGWDWNTSTQQENLQPVFEGDEVFTRFAPKGNNPFIYRGINTGEPIAGHTFRARLELRAVGDQGQKLCGGIFLSERGARHLKRKDVCLTNTWKSYEVAWTPPDEAQLPTIDVILNRFHDGVLDIRRVTLEELKGRRWQLLNPLSPVGVGVILSWSDSGSWLQRKNQASTRELQIIPSRTWRRYQLHVSSKDLVKAHRVRAIVIAERGTAVEVKQASLVTSTPNTSDPHPVPTFPSHRQKLWFSHPNLAGHTFATVGLALLSAIGSVWIGLIGIVLTLVGIFFTGSRAAWLAALIGLPWLLWLICRRRERWRIFSLLALGAAAFFLFFGADTLGRLRLLNTGDIDSVTRPEIWQTAWHAFTGHFWTGIGAQNFTAYWHAQHPDAAAVTHAHNLWLQFAASYGIFGLLAILWLTGGFVTLAWRWGRWRGLALVIPVLVMQLFDYTFFYAGVLFPLILGMNALRGRPSGRPGGHKPVS